MFFDQIDSIRQGHYLRAANDRQFRAMGYPTFRPKPVLSYTRDLHLADVGIHVGLADVALIRSIWHHDRATLMAREDLFRYQFYVMAGGILLCFLPIVPLAVAIALAVGFSILQFADVVPWSGWGWWPPATCVLLALALLSALVSRNIRWRSKAHLAQVALVVTAMGLLRYVRSDCRYFGAAPFLAVAFVNTVMLALHVASGLKKGIGLEGVRRRASECRISARIVAASVAVLLAMKVLPAVVFWGNLRLFEAIENVEHTPEKQMGHHFWHNIYIGIGAALQDGWTKLDPFNHENIVWQDTFGVNAARQQRPSIIFTQSPGYDDLVGRLFLSVLWHNPVDFFQVAFAKAKHLCHHYAEWLGIGLLAVTALLFASVRRRSTLPPVANLFLGLGALTGIAMVPPVLTCPTPNGSFGFPLVGAPFLYAVGWQAVVILTPFLCVGLWSHLAGAFRPASDEPPEVQQEENDPFCLLFPRVLVAGLLVSLVGAMALLAHLSRRGDRESRLAMELAGGRLAFENLLDAYPAQAVRAFNSLPQSFRQTLAKQRVGTAGTAVGCRLEMRAGDGSYSVEHVTWRENTVFVLLSAPRVFQSENVPLDIRFADTPPETPPTLRGWLLLPPTLRPGLWLFSFQANRQAREVLMGPVIKGRLQIYGQRMGEPTYVINPVGRETPPVPSAQLPAVPGLMPGAGR